MAFGNVQIKSNQSLGQVVCDGEDEEQNIPMYHAEQEAGVATWSILIH
jgi:hypothetical protein